MKILLSYILAISLFYQITPKHQGISIKRRKMIEFLIKNRELDTFNHDGLATYNTVINERIIYKKQTCTISIFGIFSAHSGHYIALADPSHIILLNTNNFVSEMDTILMFLKHQNIDKPNVIAVLSKIKAAYQYNIDLEKKLIVHPPSGQACCLAGIVKCTYAG
jgi:hypothetical protein